MGETTDAMPASATPRGGFLRAAAIVVGSTAASFGLTLLLRPLLGRTLFVFMYGGVALSALFAGSLGGISAAILAVVVIELFFPAADRFDPSRPADLTAIALFVLVSTIIGFVARTHRRARYAAEDAAQRLRRQAGEMEARQAETETLASELEHANLELETAIEDANDQRNAAVLSEERMRLLDNAGRVLAGSLDYETTVAAVAQLAVPRIADWCGVDLLVDGRIQHLAIAHADPAKVEFAREIGRKYPPDPDAPTGTAVVMRTGKPQLIANVTDETLRAAARDEEHLRMLREVGVYSYLIVPMIARGQTLGAMLLISSTPARHFGDGDLTLAMQLASRAAVAIDNARLYQAALAANEAKANFLATMSHELRTPLTAIIGYEELLAEGIPGQVNDVQKQQLGRIKASATHLLSLIDEILLFARVEAGRETVTLEPVVAKGVVDDAIAYVAATAKEHSLSLSTDRIDPALMLRTDAGKLRQMLLNLLTNAIKFTPSGSVTVRAFAKNGSVVFQVADTGIGITKPNLEHIFDPFWQVDQNSTREAGGSGLGLTVTKRLLDLLGGEISVESQPGKGSTFSITLPKDGQAARTP